MRVVQPGMLQQNQHMWNTQDQHNQVVAIFGLMATGNTAVRTAYMCRRMAIGADQARVASTSQDIGKQPHRANHGQRVNGRKTIRKITRITVVKMVVTNDKSY